MINQYFHWVVRQLTASALLPFKTSAFETLHTASRLVHGGALLGVTLTIILLIIPAALRRIVWVGGDNIHFLRIGGTVIATALVPLALDLMGDSYVVIARNVRPRVAIITATCLVCLLLELGFGGQW
ncbi:Hypothetical protein GbCGDNIH6_8170 [Granulibacter bethesdensis]|uniref:DUF6328 family protein n=1 Tax=Granulibacter bethesdensis TaxID=364410 RepID=UPI00090BB14B|nr:DUF6328 family protein [Granulibacter bethesdensis]APH55864.1 Hypothetical protein GbCGDNIH6_8170 [Granulibacter bethesdensis]